MFAPKIYRQPFLDMNFLDQCPFHQSQCRMKIILYGHPLCNPSPSSVCAFVFFSFSLMVSEFVVCLIVAFFNPSLQTTNCLPHCSSLFPINSISPFSLGIIQLVVGRSFQFRTRTTSQFPTRRKSNHMVHLKFQLHSFTVLFRTVPQVLIHQGTKVTHWR